ncbi:Craniofacial development protein 1 [Cichlidogyrus casuarinus]|uniref:Craniofacial development protein 1 n=1 Tax=Cichlidogyrus casuarinus TaxID=1844966 RepID=A0ABD2QB30_9PLAT
MKLEEQKTSPKSNSIKPEVVTESSKTVTAKDSASSSSLLPLQTEQPRRAVKRPATALSGILGQSLKNLKATKGVKVQKQSILEKSRTDWEGFVDKEEIDYELKAHNKGKNGYLSKINFKNETSIQEYLIQKEMQKGSCNKK